MKRVADGNCPIVMRMRRTIDDLTDLRAIELGVMAIQRRPTDLRVLVEHVLGGLQPRERARVHVECDAALSVLADAARVTRVVSRLLQLQLTTATPSTSVTIVLRRHGERAVIALLATGTHQPHLSQGECLRMYVARHAIEAHGGSLTAYEQPGTGTWIEVALPLPTSDCRRRARAFRASVLIVDSHLRQGATLAGLMRDDGFDAEAVTSGKAALERAVAHVPDIVIIDLGDTLPDMQVGELIRRLAAMPVAIPTVLIGADGTSGAQLTRPIDLPALYDELGRVAFRPIAVAG